MPVHSAFLKYFQEVCRCGSIRKAASNLYIASSAVNRQILKIEGELGTSLFERSHEGIKLTEAGKLLQQHVDRTLADAERTFREIQACYDKKSQGITIVGQDSTISNFLPPVLIALYAEFPNVPISFMAAGGRELQSLLLKGRADIALIFDPLLEPGIQKIDCITLPVSAVMTPKHPLANHKQLQVKDCAHYMLALPDDSWPVRDRLDRELAATGIDMGTVTTSNSIEFLRTMLTEKKAIGLQTTLGLERAIANGSLKYVPLIGNNKEALLQSFAICTHENDFESPVFARALDLLKQRLEEYQHWT